MGTPKLEPELLAESGDKGLILFSRVPVAEDCCSSVAGDVAEALSLVGGGSPDDVGDFLGFLESGW